MFLHLLALSCKRHLKKAWPLLRRSYRERQHGINFEPPNFFIKYKNFILLLASSSSAENQLGLVGLVKSKVHHLMESLERNTHITLAHVNPECLLPTAGSRTRQILHSVVQWLGVCRDRKPQCWSRNIHFVEPILAFGKSLRLRHNSSTSLYILS
jgi:poly(A) polymerase